MDEENKSIGDSKKPHSRIRWKNTWEFHQNSLSFAWQKQLDSKKS
eukprot:CAMPEP_0172458442 /NCGR_PEP_ID=MMETSP1065-20121228/27576_1 /TAXON_ID=265537 /ORGANISM="Amphiprora paludosa, Strain CCMP125" /LENGTH=44 /DNA_ID= /DNA_START= /DNA_END= /DNA_ORIENTATION=